ncbi:hypothetical protein [Aurantiacibacter sediminis]|uniref:PRC-barrel domain-containing protein n=1 Tax=Aurantiacibacter sediminis TaxID=2793064 RepID=A0ABS0N5K3_9SPHN|nr:hypothetical protein [Aurantiacibacter sediminis]MBH5323053.1 hypothetical protein [Aurantiacibacter sediminis]
MRIAFAAAAAAIAFSTPAMAQDVGTDIVGNDEAVIGTVEQNDGTTVVVNTGTYQVPLGTDAFAETDGVWTLNTTKAELETAYGAIMAEQEAALAAALVPGTAVATVDAQALGVIEEVGEDAVLLADGEERIALPLNLFALDAEGALIVLANHADIMAALEAQAG